jgi:hypothetical protein
MHRFTAALGVMLAMAPLSANAAEIKYQGDEDGIHYVTVVGLLVDGDAARFNQMAIRWPDKSVSVGLAGPGGKLAEGLEIGNTIRVHGYTTFVAAECASACSLVWLAGTARYVLAGGSLGFHAAYVADGTGVHENVQANAIIGAYLANLGLSYDVVAYATATASTEITWLNAAEAKILRLPS